MACEKLVLHPRNAWAILHDPPFLIDALRTMGLIGASFGFDGEIHYAGGPRFRELVVFRRLPEPQGRELHVSLSETAEEPAFLGATQALPPRCRRCGRPLSDWRAQLAAWQRDGRRRPWSCSGCGRLVALHELDWDHTGGIARYSLEVWGIRQHAAVPSAELLAGLERLTLEKWDYFYYRLGADPRPPAQPSARPW
jgi:hypothetical protein